MVTLYKPTVMWIDSEAETCQIDDSYIEIDMALSALLSRLRDIRQNLEILAPERVLDRNENKE